MYLRKYETVTLVHPEAGTDGQEKVLGRMREAIEKTGGREVRFEDWGQRKLAFRLSRHGVRRAQYQYLLYLGSNSTVAELERMMKITEEAMLWQTVLLEDRIKAEEFDFEAASEEHTPLLRGEVEPSERDDDDDDDDSDDDDDDDGEDD